MNTNTVDTRSEGIISTLLPEVQPLCRALINRAAEDGIVIKAISGLRSYDEQNSLYSQGRTTDGNIVTKAKGGYSNHNFGLAFDIGLFEDGKYIDDSPVYKTVSVCGKEFGLTWGGDWVGIEDEPHYELRPDWAKGMSERDILTELRSRKETGASFF